jgi:hypothetical protein
MRAYLVSLPRSATVEAPFAHKGAELVGVVSGLVQVLLSSGRPVLRPGETLLASRRGIDGWRNMGEGDAQCLWVLRTERLPCGLAACRSSSSKAGG